MAAIKSQIDEAGSGNVFWNITGTNERKEANLVLEYTSVSLQEVNVQLPGAKRQKVAYNGMSWPQIAVLTNPNALNKHTRLVALEDKTMLKALEARKTQKVKAGKFARRGKKAKAKAKAKGKAARA